jgi:cytochrome c biogenesis protein CcdA
VTSAATVTAGFVAVFVTLGVLLESLADRIRPDVPWVTMTIGAVLVAAGIAAVAGHRIPLPTPALRAVPGRDTTAMLSFGIVYALASLSCTIGQFLAVIAIGIDRSLAGGIATYLAYAAGMGTIILVLAAAAALARPGPSARLRRLARYAPRLGGLLMIASGSYAIWYARWELAVYRGDLANDPIVDTGERFRLDAVQLIERIGATRLGLLVIYALLILIVAARWGRRTRPGAPEPDHPSRPHLGDSHPEARP